MNPSAEYHLLELSSALFSNYAEKQRLVKLPTGEKMIYDGNGIPIFSNGTILVKTFYYFNDVRDTTLGKKVIETRLLIKSEGLWNVATYVWNDEQTDADLKLNGYDTQVSWTTLSGINRTIRYQVPNQNECISCHQLNSEVLPIGPKLRNLNIDVIRNNESINQLEHLQSLEILNDFDKSQVAKIPNYKSLNVTSVEKGRAYMEMNCAHCHSPSGWSRPARTGYDFRFETDISNTRILDNKDKIKEVLQSGEMPYLGTTVIDEEGVELVIEYINSL
ncbi:c-type cytochrome [Bernardetia sp. ABR2-2B]|uniref:c-type cytochrome n=1 Tax=Bernardetia sp. ABR2-2B TaxID=3127472 RepID=UPI0030CF4D9E